MTRNLWAQCLMGLFVFGAALAFAHSTAAQSDRITYDGVEIRPGDVINFLGGGATAITAGAAGAARAALGVDVQGLKYGHTGLYLGVDPQTHQRTFLDFTTDKNGPSIPLPTRSTNPQPFVGRILSEEVFLSQNAASHTAFDVFRLDDTSSLDQRRMLREAKVLSQQRNRWENWFGISNVCASAAAQVLSKATRMKIELVSPDSFEKPPFHKLPELRGRSIEIQAALRQARAARAVDARSAQLRQLSPQLAVAERRASSQVRRMLTVEEFAALAELRRQELLEAEWAYLRTLVGYACSDPGDLRTLNDAGRVPGVSLGHTALQGYVSRNGSNLSGCETVIFTKILATDGAAPVSSLIAWGVTYRDTHGPHVVLQKLLEAMKSCGTEISRALASLGQSSDSGSSDSTSRSSERSSRSDSPNRSSGGPRDSSTLNQLQGIAASGTWPQ